MQTVLDTEAAIEARLGKLEAIENWLKSAIRDRLRDYLRQASENYRRSGKIAEAIKAWDRLIEHYGEQLLALARNIKNVAVSFAGAAGGVRSAFGDRAQAFAELRMGADSLDRTARPARVAHADDGDVRRQLGLQGRAACRSCRSRASSDGSTTWRSSTTGTRFPPPRRWSPTRATIVAKKLTEYHASAAAALEAIAAIENQELESYWEVLRAHALAHYVQERDVDEVLNELNERYVVANIERRQRAIESQVDPYGHER